ncbi:gliding motility protein GldB-related protein [Chryseobacterium sp. M5A1_1a]
MKYFIIFLFLSISGYSQKLVSNTDVVNFWTAYDQLHESKDSLKQIEIINTEYLQKASPALRALIKMDKMSASDYVKSIREKHKRWDKVREQTIEMARQDYDIEKLYTSFKEIYPSFYSPQISFVIGTFDRGGTTTKDFILIGTEVAALTDLSGPELKLSTEYNIAHELVHVQQDYINGVNNEEEYQNLDLLGWALMEGSCDFIAEKLLGKLPYVAYMEYGRQHEKQLWTEFKKDMYLYDIDKWMYNGSSSNDKPADLAYFLGYAICKSYYDKAKDKKEALKTIISINYSKNKHHEFFEKAGYMKKK